MPDGDYQQYPAIEVMTHGRIVATGVEQELLQYYTKQQDLLPLTCAKGDATFFEITFDEFARHVVAETI